MSNQTRGLYVNDYPMDRLGMAVEAGTLTGWRDGVAVTDRTTKLPQRAGTIALAREFETEPRMVGLTLIQRASSMGLLQSRYREAKQRLYEGSVEVRFSDDPDKVVYARCERFEVAGTVRELQSPNHRVRVQLKCPDPLIYDRNGTVAGFGSVAAEMPLGSASSFPIVRLYGAVTNPVITYRDFRGDVQQTFGLTMVLGATDWVEIDMGRSTVFDQDGDPQISKHTSGSFFALDAQDAAIEGTGPFPTLEVSPACVGDVLYRKAWL